MFVSFSLETWSQVRDEVKPLIIDHLKGVEPDGAEIEYKEEQYRSMYERDNVLILAARDNGRLVGYLAGTLGPLLADSSKLQMLESGFYLMPEYRKGWTAVRMVRAMEQVARIRGATRLLLVERLKEGNASLSALYKRLHYKLSAKLYVHELEVS